MAYDAYGIDFSLVNNVHVVYLGDFATLNFLSSSLLVRLARILIIRVNNESAAVYRCF